MAADLICAPLSQPCRSSGKGRAPRVQLWVSWPASPRLPEQAKRGKDAVKALEGLEAPKKLGLLPSSSRTIPGVPGREIQLLMGKIQHKAPKPTQSLLRDSVLHCHGMEVPTGCKNPSAGSSGNSSLFSAVVFLPQWPVI